jgi:hypothetical protein
MKILYCLLFALGIASHLSAQSKADSDWFWNIGAGGKIQQTAVASRFIIFDDYETRFFQLSVGKNNVWSDKWSFVYECRLRFSHVNISYNEVLNPADNDLEQLFLTLQVNSWRLHGEIPIYFQYQMSKRWSLNIGLYAAATALELNRDRLQTYSIEQGQRGGRSIERFSYKNSFPRGELGTEFGFQYRVTEDMRLRLNIRQAVFDADFQRNNDKVSTSSFVPDIAIGINFNINKKEQE